MCVPQCYGSGLIVTGFSQRLCLEGDSNFDFAQADCQGVCLTFFLCTNDEKGL